jgi:AraC family transcriptional regulator
MSAADPLASTSRLVEWQGRRVGRAPHEAPVSIHVGTSGRELYRTPDGLYAVEEGTLLVLNAGQTVSTHVDPAAPSTGCAVLFAPELVRDVGHALVAGEAALLDDPGPRSGTLPLLAERTHTVDEALAVRLDALRRGGAARREERLHDLVEAVLRLDRAAARGADRVPAVRASTRAELYRRLQRARDYLHARVEPGATLPELARVAALSPHRLLRLFRATFGHTPQQYLRELRMERAARLLRETDAPVGAVADAVGFDSFGSFSWAFRRRFGVPPRSFRARGR